MLFWRAKSAKQATDDKAADGPADKASESSPEAQDDTAVTFVPADEVVADNRPPSNLAQLFEAATPKNGANANVVTLTPARLSERLSERLAEAGAKRDVAERVTTATPVTLRADSVIEADDAIPAPGQTRALDALRAGLADGRNGSHVLVLGPAGTGRRSAAISLAKDIAQSRATPRDWVYAATGRTADQLQAYNVASGTAARFVRDVEDALSKSTAMLSRLIASDTHQMSLAVLEEEHRQRSDGPLDHLKRRAEAQNIALVKTSEGFVLAPMHEGRVVKADVFRALPEALQRDVESKVTVLESELQALLGALPGNDVATDDRHLALCQQTAERAVKPNLAVARKLFNGDAAVAAAFDAIEADWTRRATELVRRSTDGMPLTVPALQAIASSGEAGAPVVVARAVGVADLIGEIGRDASGAIAVRPGHVARANGGFLIIDAWRLAADPQAWAALSAVLETATLQPLSGPGIAVTADPMPVDIKLVLIAEQDSLAKLKAIDPRVSQYFGAVVQFNADAAAVDISEDTFAVWAAALADAAGLRKLSSLTAGQLYDDARARAGDVSRVSLDIASLVQTLRIADGLAADAARQHISSDDIKTAIARRSALQDSDAVS
ncbi:MAG: AAA family ATPase [Hyphomicrobium sp.]